jgi:hypothetical protein
VIPRRVVAGDDQHLLLRLFGLARERRDDVIGLLAVDLDDRDAVDGEYLAHQRELRAQLVGRLGALRFVARIERDARRRQTLVERGNDVSRLLVGDELDHHHREAVGRVDVYAARRGEIGQREERAVHQTVRVEQHETRGVRLHRKRHLGLRGHQRTSIASVAAPTSPSSETFSTETT